MALLRVLATELVSIIFMFKLREIEELKGDNKGF
jgi:hypothetical protein